MAGIEAIVQAYAKRLGLDPRAVLSISQNESGRRRYAVGDQGTSFGPFQLHRGGALPAGKGLKWAGSNQGILYAMRQMANSGARGKQGAAAINAIARNFERPADPAKEIATALSWYRKGGRSIPAGMTAPAGPSVGQIAGAIGGGPDLAGRRQAVMQYALANSRALLGQGDAPDPVQFMQSMQQTALGTPDTNTKFGSGGGRVKGVNLSGKNEMLDAIRYAQAHGLHVSENEAAGDKVDPVHVEGSYHYKKYPGSNVNEASDISGNPAQMAAYFKWARKRYGKNLTELFYDPLGGIKYGKPIPAIGGHKDHVHIAFGG